MVRLTTLLVLIFLYLGGIPSHSLTANLVGSTRVIDGNTLTVGSIRIRLQGINASESR